MKEKEYYDSNGERVATLADRCIRCWHKFDKEEERYSIHAGQDTIMICKSCNEIDERNYRASYSISRYYTKGFSNWMPKCKARDGERFTGQHKFTKEFNQF